MNNKTTEIREGFRMTEICLLPGEWGAIKLGDYADEITSGGTPSREIKEYFLNGNIRWLKTAELRDKEIYGSEEKITESGLKESSAKVFPINTVLIAMYGATIGKLGLLKKECATNQACCAFICHKNDYKYLFYYLLNSREKLISLGAGAGQPNISQGILKSFPIPLPPFPEQCRIAEILSVADETIERTGALIAKYRQIKEGVMTDLLESGIDEAGRIRSEGTHEFKDSPLGRVPEGWKVVSLRKISETITKGTTPTTYGHNYTKTGISFLRVENITESGHIDLNDIKFISSEANEFLNRSKLEEGDVLFSIAGAIGRCALVSSGILPANINQAISLIRFKNGEQLNLEFILQMLLSINVKSQIELEATSLAQTNLNLEQVKNIKLPIPPLPEQRRIAEILRAADNRIEKEEAYRDKLLQIKKGLMQDLLTGKVRTKTGADA